MIFMYFQEEDIRSMLAAKFQVFSTFGSNFNLAGGSFVKPTFFMIKKENVGQYWP